MRKLLALALALVAVPALAQYSSKNVKFLSNVPLSSMPQTPGNAAGISGYVSPSGREYAILCTNKGYMVYEITKPTMPKLVGHVTAAMTNPGNALWHEVCVLGQFAYGVTEAGGGIRIIDLRQVDNGIVSLAGVFKPTVPDPTAGSVTLDTAHTIQANPATKRLFVNGSSAGFVVVNATNPISLQVAGRWLQPDRSYVHDSTIVNYTSGLFAGKEIVFAFCGPKGLWILDSTNPSAITTIGRANHLSANTYSHSGVLTSDKRYILLNDEFDESDKSVPDATTHIYDVQDLRYPMYVSKFTNAINAIDHNSELRGGYMLLSSYTAGLRIYDVRNPLAIKEAGFFDSSPNDSGKHYAANWSVFGGYPSGLAVLGDIERGLFVVDPRAAIEGIPHTPVAVSKLEGGTASGGLTQIVNSDNTYYSVPSSSVTRSGHIASAVTTFTSAFSSVQSMKVYVEGSTVAGASGLVYLWNWSTNAWVHVGGVALSGTESTRTLEVGGRDFAPFLNANRQFRMLTRAISPESVSRPATAFTLRLDRINVSVKSR